MDDARELELDGSEGSLYAAAWPRPDARYVAIVVHGYAEHVGRYAHVIERLLADGATVYGLDHLGHGRSEGERALVTEGEHLTADLGLLVTLARSENPGLPLVMIGHSMGGLIATRYAQTHPGRARCARALGSGDRCEPGDRGAAGARPDPRGPDRPGGAVTRPGGRRGLRRGPARLQRPVQARDVALPVRGGGRGGRGPELRLAARAVDPRRRGRARPYAPVAEAFEHLRGEASEEKAYPGARHEIFNETNRDEVLDDVVAFINAQISS